MSVQRWVVSCFWIFHSLVDIEYLDVLDRRMRFVSCSATISSPKDHMMNIFGVKDVEVITVDGAPSGRKDFLVWNPPYIDPDDPSLGRFSSMAEATKLMRFLMTRGVRVILFCKVCEILTT